MLGKWGVIDIETTGIDPQEDRIIDIGFLLFDHTKCTKRYSSLIKTSKKIPHFIQKLTGITSSALKDAPDFEEVNPYLQSLEGHLLVAHNSSFEESFLGEKLTELFIQSSTKVTESANLNPEFVDSLPFLGKLFPERSRLGLESFLCDWGIKDKEDHRGFEDSLDLLKVMLVASSLKKEDPLFFPFYQQMVERYHLQENFWFHFLNLEKAELQEIASEISFDVVAQTNNILEKKRQEEGGMNDGSQESFQLPPFSMQSVEKILSEEIKIQEKIPGYQFRESQLEMSKRIGQSFKNNVHSMIQAPTGTGKTLGYLIPATLYALNEKDQVLMATGTKALQNQLIESDIPKLKAMLNLEDELKIVSLIGSQNHYCELLFRKIVEEESLEFLMKDHNEKYAFLFFEFLFHHNENHSYQKKIKRGDFSYSLLRSFQGIADLDKQLKVDFRACISHECPYKNNCSYYTGLQNAKEANIIVGNHALTFSWPKFGSRPPKVIIDEAHKMEGSATSAFSLTISQDDLKDLSHKLNHLQGIGSLFFLMGQVSEYEDKIKDIRSEILTNQQILDGHLLDLTEKIELFFKKNTRYTSLYWNELPMISESHYDEMAKNLLGHFQSMAYIVYSLHDMLSPFSSIDEMIDKKIDNNLMALARFETFLGQIEDLYLAFKVLLKEEIKNSSDKDTEIEVDLNKTNYSRSIKYHETHGYKLESIPIDVGHMISQNLLENSDSVVFTSATLADHQGEVSSRAMEWILGYLNVSPEKRFKKGFHLQSTFNYQKNCKVLICDDTEPLYSSQFVSKTMEKIIPVIRNLSGRSLLLFSARTRFDEAKEYLLEKLGQEFPFFIQGMGTNVIEEYKKADNGVLLGMESFGEGIDIPGKALSFLFIDKIPDLRMDLVIQERRKFFDQNFGNEFFEYFLASRARYLHQKLGRLIRSESDVGVAVIVDSRIQRWKHSTFDQFQSLMNPYLLNKTKLEKVADEVQSFFTKI